MPNTIYTDLIVPTTTRRVNEIEAQVKYANGKIQ